MFMEGEFEMIQAIAKTTVTQSILDEMIKLIKNNTWMPGEKIPSENELAIAFSVGRNSVREAVKILNKMNVLISRPGQGTFLAKDAISNILSSELIITGYKNASFEEIAEIRTLLESQCAYWAAQRVDDSDIVELINLLESMRASEKSTLLEQNKIHYIFHETIIRLSKNSLLKPMLLSIKAEIDNHHARFDTLSPNDIAELINDQEKVLLAIIAKMPDRARDAMRYHLERAQKFIEKECKMSKQ